MRSAPLVAAAILFSLLAAGRGAAEEKADATKLPPRVLFTTPLAVVRGSTTKLLLRGVHLADATEVRVEGAGKTKEPARATIKAKAKSAAVTPLTAAQVGDSQIEIELTLPADAAGDEVRLVVVTAAGIVPAQSVRVFDASAVTMEKEPNGGFANAQPITLPTTIIGTAGDANDVDVFRVDAKAGQKLVAQVIAARLGSPLDSLLTLYDARGHVVATNDDGDAGADSMLNATFPADGVYYLTLTDANSRGGPMYGYLLSVRRDDRH